MQSLAGPSLGGGDMGIGGGEESERHVTRLAAAGIEQQIAGALTRQRGVRMSSDKCQHQIHLRHGGTCCCHRSIAYHEGIHIEGDVGMEGTKDRCEPPCRGDAPAGEDAGIREQKDTGTGGCDFRPTRNCSNDLLFGGLGVSSCAKRGDICFVGEAEARHDDEVGGCVAGVGNCCVAEEGASGAATGAGDANVEYRCTARDTAQAVGCGEYIMGDGDTRRHGTCEDQNFDDFHGLLVMAEYPRLLSNVTLAPMLPCCEFSGNRNRAPALRRPVRLSWKVCAMRQLMAMGPGQMEWHDDVPEPVLLTASDALVRPVALSICDADVAYLQGKFQTRDPFCFGHEFVADVVSLGDEVSGFAVGDRVVVSFLIACGTCRRCLQGLPAACLTVGNKAAFGFGIFGDWGGAGCDLIRVPYAATMMMRLPEGMSATDAASAGDNLSDAFRCVADGLAEEPGTPVLIVAGDGETPSVSLYAAALARALGSEQVDYLDSDPSRLAIAEALGVNAIEMAKAPKSYGSYFVTADTSGDVSGAWLSTALRSTAPYGRCTSCGVYHRSAPVPLGTMYSQGVRFMTGWTNVQVMMPKVLALLDERRVNVKPIHTIARWDDAVDALKEPPWKLILARDEVM